MEIDQSMSFINVRTRVVSQKNLRIIKIYVIVSFQYRNDNIY